MEFQLPELGEGVYEAEMSRWLVKQGDTVKPGQGLLEVLTDKATMEVPAPFAGTIETLRANEGQQLKVGDVVLDYHAAKEVTAKEVAATKPKPVAAFAEEPAAPPARAEAGNGAQAPVKAAPSVRVLARKLGVDMASVKGTGPGGRILVEDVTRSLPTSPATKPEAPAADHGTPGTRRKLQGLRRLIAEHMVRAKQTIPHYTYVDEVDVTDLVRVRDGLRATKRITYLPFFVKAVVRALKEVPLVNASLDDAAGEIVLHDKYHIGYAVATPAGLVVPVLHDADRRSVLDLAQEIDRLSNAARDGKAKREDLVGGTYSVTSIGNLGGLFATPIINHPQVGILGIGKIVKRPVFDAHGQIRAADMLYLSFSFDHRVVDGAVGTAFGNAVIQQLKNPVALLVE